MPIFAGILALGQFIFAIGGYRESFGTMLAGRFVYGLGGENMLVGQSAVITAWFKEKELAMAFGISSTVLRGGSFANGPLMEHLASTKSVGYSFMVGFWLCIFSLVSGILLVIVDSYAAKKDNMKTTLDDNERFRCKDLKQFKLPYWLVNISSVFFYAAVFTYIANAEDMFV